MFLFYTKFPSVHFRKINREPFSAYLPFWEAGRYPSLMKVRG